MHPNFLTLYVRDVPAAMTFYGKAFGLQQTFITDAGDFATTDSWLSFAAVKAGKELLETDLALPDSATSPQSVEFGFECPDVEGAYQRALDAGATAFQAPTVRPWGQKVAYIRDPDGHLVCVCAHWSPDA